MPLHRVECQLWKKNIRIVVHAPNWNFPGMHLKSRIHIRNRQWRFIKKSTLTTIWKGEVVLRRQLFDELLSFVTDMNSEPKCCSEVSTRNTCYHSNCFFIFYCTEACEDVHACRPEGQNKRIIYSIDRYIVFLKCDSIFYATGVCKLMTVRYLVAQSCVHLVKELKHHLVDPDMQIAPE